MINTYDKSAIYCFQAYSLQGYEVLPIWKGCGFLIMYFIIKNEG